VSARAEFLFTPLKMCMIDVGLCGVSNFFFGSTRLLASGFECQRLLGFSTIVPSA